MNASRYLHKHALDEDLVRRRVVRLVENLLASLQNAPDVFISYVELVSDKHIDQGVILHELQLALIALEENAWQIVVAKIPLQDRVRCLGLITLIIGTAKDRVAHIFLHHLEMVESEVSFLRRRSGFLEQGTDSAPVTEDDLNWQRGTVHPTHEMV
ncbi:MAG: hypothetical protein QNL91_17190 [Candidatus Krumholzibacteria bacterium]|nr:hypothetical protein [Candidatus Krumholzibacteria bacterium]